MKKLLPWLWLPCVAACAQPSGDPPGAPWGVPITGGTMLVTHDGHQAVIADPDADRVLTVDLARGETVGVVKLLPGDEPGRLVEDGAGRVHVALRRGGALLTLGGANHDDVLARRAVCAEPRGLAWQASTDVIHVACAGGDLVSLRASGGAPIRHLHLDRDLRDVVVEGDHLRVSRFRTAELLTIDAGGAVVDRTRSPTTQRFVGGGPIMEPPQSGMVDAIPAVAWRTIALPDGRIAMLHQRQVQEVLDTSPDGYRGDCGGPVETALSTFVPGQPAFASSPSFFGPLAVDVAVAPAGDRLAVAVVGQQEAFTLPITALEQPDNGDGCRVPVPDTAREPPLLEGRGAPTAVAFTPSGELAIFYPEEPSLVIRSADETTERAITLPGERGVDDGRRVFHMQTASGLACASCHPEGREDGLVWQFATLGSRRTQMVAGHVLERAPYHWDGDQTDLTTLMTNVFTGRMDGGELSSEEVDAVGAFLERVPAPAPAGGGDEAAIARGKALFESSEVGCAGCHNGALLTDGQRVAVGTGGVDNAAFKVPSLVGIGARAPYMHDGCAATLRDRFGACGGGDAHGHTSQLSAAQVDDLVAYLDSL
ncbi:MAG TPA: c-type cytochrome [Kofleriaceae bacterium]|nr:c-type cytochrome [Kofleriaceae bacterium]